MQVEAGQSIAVAIEINLAKPNMSLDWALTAWGFDGEISVEILLKDKDTWNFIEKDDSQLPQPTSCSDYNDAAIDAFEAI